MTAFDAILSHDGERPNQPSRLHREGSRPRQASDKVDTLPLSCGTSEHSASSAELKWTHA
eukprot:15465787-Alexandrium_andersonii.AAC.1